MNLSLSLLKELGFGIFRVVGAMTLNVGLLILIDEYQLRVLQDKCRANVRPPTIVVARETLSARTAKHDVREEKGKEESADTYGEYIFDINYASCTDPRKWKLVTGIPSVDKRGFGKVTSLSP